MCTEFVYSKRKIVQVSKNNSAGSGAVTSKICPASQNTDDDIQTKTKTVNIVASEANLSASEILEKKRLQVNSIYIYINIE